MNTAYSAAPSALGYFYQCEIALLEMLRRGDPALEVSIELLDDVAFEGEQTELLQAKYHVNPGNLTDGSADLWKTLRVWSDGAPTNQNSALILMTTSVAVEGSIAAELRPGPARNSTSAHNRLVSHAKSASGATLARARAAFLALSDDERRDLVDRIIVIDSAPLLDSIDEAFHHELRYAAPADRRDALVARLREWWLIRAEQIVVGVASGASPRVSFLEVEARIADLRDQLSADNLPNDLEELPPPTDDAVSADQRKFVMQLRLISLANARIRIAVHDYNRAFAQRARWLREDLVELGELRTYEQRLIDEWQRVWLPETDDDTEMSEDDAAEFGRSVHRACDEAVVEPIRVRATAPYIMRGSMQMLADELRIGWHKDWVGRMQELLEEATP